MHTGGTSRAKLKPTCIPRSARDTTTNSGNAIMEYYDGDPYDGNLSIHPSIQQYYYLTH